MDAIGLFYFFMLIPPHAWYYGDSLAWQIPSNMHRLVSLLQQVQTKSGITLLCPNVQYEVLHHPGSRDDHYGHICRDKCKLFCPIQTCTNVCGVVSVIMAALLSQNTMARPDSNVIPQQILSIQNATTYSAFLHQVLMHCTINKHFDLHMFSHSSADITIPNI